MGMDQSPGKFCPGFHAKIVGVLLEVHPDKNHWRCPIPNSQVW